MTGSRQETVAAGMAETTAANSAEARLVAGARRELDRSCAALDGSTLSRLNSIRHAALEHKLARRHRSLLFPFGGLVTACLLVVTVLLLDPGATTTPQRQDSPPLEDIELLTDAEGLDFYEDYEFYQWLAESGRSI